MQGSVLRAIVSVGLMMLTCGEPASAANGFRSGVASLALWSDPVFRSEAGGGAAVVAEVYGHGGPVIVKANTPRSLVAGPRGIAGAIAAAGRGLDSNRDVLFVILTSHGAPEGIGDKGGGSLGIVRPEAFRALLARSPVRHKVLIVSACFSGIFAPLANPDTLVVTAADATHTSFGCQPGARWTYFGDAFFDKALRRDRSMLKAFVDATALIAAREAAQGFAPSNPQFIGGDAVLSILDGRP